eukprot:TRINITY_DN2244_c0_g1_i2.p1 TRINITY_DN2244_c0_g1~~TRINITY_DN2244_c0_g1_i2.p1  ORF type:complete len:672 (+),score=240.75 TRINITY_DN2244_c0_g1_i2:43-2058(+)
MGISDAVDGYFEITKRGSSYAQEIRGGVATFLTMSYILLVNPQVLTGWIATDGDGALKSLKDDFSKDIATATAITCCLGCVMVGVLSKMPFAVGPGMGLNTLVAGLLVRVTTEAELDHAKEVWGEVVATTFLTGVVLTLISGVGLVSPAIAAMPDTIKTSIMVGIGAYQAFIGVREMGIIAKSDTDYVTIEDFPSFAWDERQSPTSGYAQLLFVLSLALTTILFLKGVKGSILLGIVFCTAICWIGDIGGSSFPVPPVAVPTFTHTFLKVYFESWFKDAQSFVPRLVVILLITIFDCGGVQFGIGKLLNLPKIMEEQESRKHNGNIQTGSEVVSVFEDDEPTHPRRRPSLLGTMIEKAGRVGDAIEERYERAKLQRQLSALKQLEDSDIDMTMEKEEIKARLAVLNETYAESHEGSPLLEGSVAGSNNPHGQLLPGRTSQLTFITVGLMNMVGAMFGSSPNIIFLECAAGVKEGARTGFCSVVTGLLFGTTVVLTPLFQNVPLCASAGPLVFIGCLMMSHVGEIQWGDLRHALPAFLTILMMPFTSSITPGIGFGLGFYIALRAIDWVYEWVATVTTRRGYPLHAAAEAGDLGEFKKQLTRHDGLVNSADREGNTPLHVAVTNDHLDIVRALLDNGADASVVNNDLHTPLQTALYHSRGKTTRIVSLLQRS